MNWLLPALLVGGVVFGAPACGSDSNGDGLKKVTVMLDWTPNTNHAGIFLAKEEGWYRDAGLDVQIVEPASGGVEQVVAAGKADFGISVQEQVIPARAQGIPIVSIGAIMQHNTSSLFALAKSGITRPKDLEGKTYGGFGGALETALVKKMVTCDGGDASRVKFVEVGNVDYLVGMEQGAFDFAWIFDGWDGLRATEVEHKQVTSLPFINYPQCIPDWYTPLIITNESHVKSQPDLVKKFMQATARGYDEAIANPQASADALLKNAPESDKTLVNASAKYLAARYVDKGRQWGLQDADTWSGFAKFLKEAGLVDREIDTKSAFTNEFLPKR